MDNELTIRQLQAEVDKWITTVGAGYHSPLTNTAILAEETGEVARIMARRYGDQVAKPSDDLNLADELADVLWVVAALANQCDINLSEAFARNLQKKNLRDSKRFSPNLSFSNGAATAKNSK